MNDRMRELYPDTTKALDVLRRAIAREEPSSHKRDHIIGEIAEGIVKEFSQRSPRKEPCPHCGSVRKIGFCSHSNNMAADEWSVTCGACGMDGPTKLSATDAVKAWNQLSKRARPRKRKPRKNKK